MNTYVNDTVSQLATTDEIWAPHLPRLVRLCARLTGDPIAAEDLAQETLIEGWKHLDSLQNPDAFAAWLNGIARNVCRQWYRRTAPRRTTSLDHDGTETESTWRSDLLSLEESLERDELLTLLDRALEALPADTRTILLRKYLDELSHAEIANRLNLSEGAVTMRLQRGKSALQRVIQKEFTADAEAFGLITGQVWEETRIWCPVCGQGRLEAWYLAETGQSSFRCRHCMNNRDTFITNSCLPHVFAGVTRYKTLLNREYDWALAYYQTAFTHGFVACDTCGTPTYIRTGDSEYRTYPSTDPYGFHLWCDTCKGVCQSSLGGYALMQPEVRRFWNRHQRMYRIPPHPDVRDGMDVYVARYAARNADEAIEVVFHQESYDILAINEGEHE